MNKELTPLEALNELVSFCCDVYYREIYDKDFEIIETKLKDYEELEKKLGFDPTIFKQDFETLMKEHKALEIIKDKKVDIYLIYRFTSADRYNDYLGRGTLWRDRLLTQEEYNLLKEVLL